MSTVLIFGWKSLFIYPPSRNTSIHIDSLWAAFCSGSTPIFLIWYFQPDWNTFHRAVQKYITTGLQSAISTFPNAIAFCCPVTLTASLRHQSSYTLTSQAWENLISYHNLQQHLFPASFMCFLFLFSNKPMCPKSAILMSLFLIGPGFIKGLPVIHGDSLCLYVHTLWINYFAQPF